MPGPAASGLPGLLAGYFLRTTVVLTLALLAAAAARRRPAALRHFILSAALIGLLLLPLLSIVPIGWRSPLVPAWMAPAERGGGSEIGTMIPGHPPARAAEGPAAATPGDEILPDRALYATVSSIIGEVRPDGPRASPVPGVPAGRGSAAAGAAASGPAAAESRSSLSGSGGRALDRLIALLWSAGLAVLVLRLAVGLAGALRLTAEGTPLGGPAWRALLARFVSLVSLRRAIRLKSHPEVLVPLTWGWRRPVVLLPPGADAWSEEERSSALFHELSHVKRGDFLVMLLVRTSLAVFWWNPLGWVLYRRLLREQEAACDELVLRAGIRPSSYAASLLAFRRSAGFHWNPSAALLGMLGRSSFQERLAAILKQKLTLMEVKMKTKIMLALALALAVALIGTARPVSGTEADAAVAVLAAAEAPVSMAMEAGVGATDALAAADEQTSVQEKEKAKAAEKAKAEQAAKEKAAAEKTIILKPAGGEGKPLEIVITEGGEVKTLVLEKPLTITKSLGGEALVLSVDGKEIQVLKGEPLRLEIKGGSLQVVKEGGLIKVGEGGKVQIIKEKDGQERKIVFFGDVKPEVVVEAAPEVFVKLGKDIKEGEKWVQAAPAQEARTFKVVREGKPAFVWTAKEDGRDMLEKVKALQEQVQAIKAKKLELSALEESLKKLAAELEANAAKLKDIGIKFEKSPGTFTVVKRIGEDEVQGKTGVWAVEKGKAAGEEKAKVMVGIGDTNDRTISLVFTGQTGEAGRAAFEKAVAKLEQELPEGYKIIEQKYDPDKGTMNFKVTAPEGGKTDATFIRKLVESVKGTLKSGK